MSLLPIFVVLNRVANLISTYVPQTVQRFDKKEKGVKDLPCPQIIKDYNRYMGGVDLMDSSMSRLRIMMKNRKWTHRQFYHFLDMTCVNACKLHRRINKDSQMRDFHTTQNTFPLRGHPNLENQI